MAAVLRLIDLSGRPREGGADLRRARPRYVPCSVTTVWRSEPKPVPPNSWLRSSACPNSSDLVQLLRRDADPGVPTVNARARSRPRPPPRGPAAELTGSHQVEQHLFCLPSRSRARSCLRWRRERRPPSASGRAVSVTATSVSAALEMQVEVHATGLDLGQVEHVVDQRSRLLRSIDLSTGLHLRRAA